MCGIAGELSWSAPPDRRAVAAMTARLAHRGPDAEGLWQSGAIALGHRRLTVIDPTAASNQPFADRTERVWLVYNGEIYNFRQLRGELERLGHRFSTRGDVEVIVEAYKAWGPRCLERFNGMFAFALWDAERRELLLARDRLGEKPLFYQELPDGGLLFASELDALRLHPRASRRVSPEAVGQFLSLNYTLRPALAGVRRLPAAHYLVASEGRLHAPCSYWDLAAAFRNKAEFSDEQEAAAELDRCLDAAVGARLVSDVPLGAFLSGGVDSSVVVESMVRLGERAVHRTFSIGFAEESFSELPKARRVATHLGVDHSDKLVTADMSRLLPQMVRAAGEPFGDGSMVPTWYLGKFARERVTVCLSGDGADEIFAGYETYVADQLHRRLGWLPAGAARGLASIVDRLWPVSFDKVGLDDKLRRFTGGLALDWRRAHHHWRTIFSPEEKLALLQPGWQELATCDGFDTFLRHYDAAEGCHPLDQAMYVDIKTWLVDDILVKVDRATMAHSLESRAPFLDPDLVKFAAALPPRWKLRGRRSKHLLKNARAAGLPPGHLDQRKEGFGAPLSHWLLGPLGELASAATSSAALAEWVRPAEVERLWREHRERRRDNGYKLFGLACLALWLEQVA